MLTIVDHICQCLSQQQQSLNLLASAEEKVFFALMQPFNNRCGLLSFIVIDQCLQGLKIQNIILSLACFYMQNTNCDEMQNFTMILIILADRYSSGWFAAPPPW